MKPNEKLRDELFQIIENQLDTNDPPETKITYNRLLSLDIMNLKQNSS